jgi:hypothetical protein
MVVVVFLARIRPGIEKETEETDASWPNWLPRCRDSSRIPNTRPPMAMPLASWSSSRTKRLLRGARIPSIAKTSGLAESDGSPNTGLPSATRSGITRSRLDSIKREEEKCYSLISTLAEISSTPSFRHGLPEPTLTWMFPNASCGPCYNRRRQSMPA